MPWKGQAMEEQRLDFVRRALTEEKSKKSLCLEYGISRPTGDKWIKRFLCGESLNDKSKAPFHTPNKTSAAIEEAVVLLRLKHPAIGAKKLKRMLENQGKPAPAYSTINAILHRNGLITKEATQAATPYKRFEKESPNDMWQADFKGHFAMQNSERCHPLTVLDDHSRYCLCIDAKQDERYAGTKESFLRMFENYGLPKTLLCDNGNPWGTSQSSGYTKFEVWLMNLGILTIHGRIRHPQTQGKEERFNGTLKKELLKHRRLEDFSHAQQQFDEFRHFYNHQRPHHALNLETPSSRYTSSKRKLPKTIEKWEYNQDFTVRKIKTSGYINFNGQGYFISEAFAGKTVGIIEAKEQSNIFMVCYRQFCVAKINVDERVTDSRKPSRI